MSHQFFHSLGEWKPESLPLLGWSSHRIYASHVLICWFRSWHWAATYSRFLTAVTPFSASASQSSNSRHHLLRKILGYMGWERKFLTQFCSSGCRAFIRMTKGVLVAVAHHKTKSGLVKVPFVLCQISSECRGGEVLAELLPQLYLPTPIWNKMVKVSRNFRTTPCTSVQHRLDSWDWKKSSFFKTWILEYEVAALRHVQTRQPKYFFSSPYLW